MLTVEYFDDLTQFPITPTPRTTAANIIYIYMQKPIKPTPTLWWSCCGNMSADCTAVYCNSVSILPNKIPTFYNIQRPWVSTYRTMKGLFIGCLLRQSWCRNHWRMVWMTPRLKVTILHVHLSAESEYKLHQSWRLRIAEMHCSAKSIHEQGAPNPMESDRHMIVPSDWWTKNMVKT